MSSKWNNNQKMQKTPKVCKPPPPPPPDPIVMFRDFPLQGFASWTGQGTPIDGTMCGMATLAADPPNHVHEGNVVAEPFTVNLHLHWNPVTTLFTLTARLYLYTSQQAMYTKTWFDPAPQLAFSAGLFTWDADAPYRRVATRLFS